jgi:hypothetical protein
MPRAALPTSLRVENVLAAGRAVLVPGVRITDVNGRWRSLPLVESRSVAISGTQAPSSPTGWHLAIFPGHGVACGAERRSDEAGKHRCACHSDHDRGRGAVCLNSLAATPNRPARRPCLRAVSPAA